MNEFSTESGKLSENEQVCHLLKITNSVRLVLVPGAVDNLEKKQVSWNITKIDEYGMTLKLWFAHPVYIARDELLD